MRKWILLIVVLLAFGAAPTLAQMNENESPLLQMLVKIPDTSGSREYFSYIDYWALLASRPGVPEITSWQELTSLSRQELALFVNALTDIASGPDFFKRDFGFSDEALGVVGFDLLGIERAISYGNPPENVNLLEGNFDVNAVSSAHKQRQFTESTLNSVSLLCPPKGCDSGMTMDLKTINHANPFGGDLGREQPVIVANRLIASSISLDAVTQSASTIAGLSPSLADQPDYRAAAEAISANGRLIQSDFIAPTQIQSLSSTLPNARMTDTQIETLTAQLQADFVPLPPYNLVVLADTASESEQQALIVLVYTTEAQAQAAAEVFPKQLQIYTSLITRKPLADLLSDRGVTSVTTTVYAATMDRYVTILTLHAPLPSSEIPESGRMPRESRLVYSLLVQAYMQHDIGWLATEF